jgi:tetratricopeptide (TPR) repeat protein
MKQYYYADNNQQLGPFTIDELKTKRLKKSTLLWTEGMKDWTIGHDINELKNILISEPPPLPQKPSTQPLIEAVQIKQAPIPVTTTKHDLTYEKETEATTIGIILIVVPLAIKISGVLTFDTVESYNEAKLFLSFTTIAIRIAVTVWVVKIASRQNRNSTGWGWFSFFLPSIALIIIGQLRKIRLKIELDESLPLNEQASILLNKADLLFSDNRYSECIEILNKAIEIDTKNFDCIKLRGLVHYKTTNYQKSKIDFETLVQNEKFPSVAYFYLGNLAIIDKNRDLAVSYWLKADENKNEKAQIKLDQFHTYMGKYLLDNSQVLKKIDNSLSDIFICFRDGKYKGGLPQLDQIQKPDSLKTQMNGYNLGLIIELKRTFKTFYLAISYYEIDDIIYQESNKMFELHLFDKNILKFSYDQTKDFNQGLENMCKKFELVTGKRPEASSSFII